jgi:AcrR family transcriptional regulator
MARQSDPLARSRLVEAAADVFTERGLERSKVAEIALRAGVSKGAFYLHFQSKDEAFREVVQAVLGRIERFLTEEASRVEVQEPSDFGAALKAWRDVDLKVFDYVWNNRAVVRLTLEGGGSADYRHLVNHFAEGVQKHVEEMLRTGVEVGMYRSSVDLNATAAFIAGGYDRFARQLVREIERPNIEQLVCELQTIVVLGVGTPRLIECLDEIRRSTEP